MVSADPWRGNPSHNFHLPHLGKMHLPHFSFPLLHLRCKKLEGDVNVVPKGCLALYVGEGDEEQQRCVIPVEYVNHPLFEKLLKEAEEEYGFDYNGTITIPCHVSHFLYVQDIIHTQNHQSHAHVGCFN